MIKSGKKGQVWAADFIIGIMLFIIVLVISVKVIMDIYPTKEDTMIYRDAIHLSDGVLGKGFPEDWENDINSVVMPGVAENNRIDNEKLSKFSELEYYSTKNLLHVTSDYIFFIRNGTKIINTGKCIYGYNLSVDENCTPILSSEYYDTLTRIDRVIIYNSTAMILTVYTWN